jgi:nicotinamide-nucleotide amidase
MEYNISEEYVSNLVDRIMLKLIDKKLTVATSESCTGGMVAARLVDYSGASAVFINGFVTYTNESKHRLLGVSNETLEKYGAVSHQTAEEMCLGAAKVTPTNIGLSTTGVAGPGGGTAEKPVGLVYIGVALNSKVTTKELKLNGNRTEIRKQATTAVLELLEKVINE